MKKKSWFAVMMAVPFVLACISGISFYFVLRSPDILTSVVEWGLSRFIQAPVSVKSVDLLRDPLRIRLKQLRLDLHDGSGSYLEINHLGAQFSFSGSFGDRELCIDSLHLRDVLAELSADAKLPEIFSSTSPKTSPGLFDALLSTVTFQSINLKSVIVTNGRVIGRKQNQRAEISQIKLKLDPPSVVTASMVVLFQSPQDKIKSSPISIAINADTSMPEMKKDFSGEMLLTTEYVAVDGIMFSDINALSKLSYDAEKRLLNLKGAELSSIAASLPNEALNVLLPRPVVMNFSAMIDLDRGVLNNSTWRLAANDLAELQGSAEACWKASPQYKINISDSWLSLVPLNSLLAQADLDGAAQLDVKEKADLKGNFIIRPFQENYQLSGRLAVDFRGNKYSFQHKNASVRGKLKGELEISGDWPENLGFEGGLESQHTHFSYSAVNLDDLNFRFRFKGRYPDLHFQNIGFEIPFVDLSTTSTPIKLNDVKGRATGGNLDLKSFSGRLSTLKIESNRLKPIVIRGHYDDATTAFHISSSETGVLEILREFEILPVNWQVAAGEVFQADLNINRKKEVMEWQIWSELNHLKYEIPDKEIIAEDLAIAIKGNGNAALDGSAIKGNFKIKCHSGEFLFDRFYLNLLDYPFNLNTEIAYSKADGSVEFSHGTVKFESLAQATFDVEHYPEQDGWTQFHISLPETDIVPLYNFGLKEPFELDNPALGTIGLTGSLGGDFDIGFDDEDWQVKGICRWHHGGMEMEEKKIALSGIHLEFPVWLISGSTDKELPPLKGKLSLKNFKVPHLAEQPLSIPLIVTPNHIAIPKKLAFQAHDRGWIFLWPLEASIDADWQLSMDTRLDIDDWQFDAGLSHWWPSQGPIIVKGSLNPVQIRQNRMIGQGILSTYLFGGIVNVTDPKIEGLFTSPLTFGLDMSVRNVRLADLTNQTNFGKIEGVLQGRIDQLEIVNKQPQRFSLRLETIPQKGIPQKISVEAVESIASIGGGQSPFVGLAGHVAALFKRFGYRKIGVVASLENDMFQVNGLIHEKGLEYFVKKSGLSGVDVVNSNPDNRIGFKDMLKRIQRVLAPHVQPVVR